MKLHIDLRGIFAPVGMVNFTADFKKRMIRATKLGMEKSREPIRQKIVADAATGLKIKRQVILKSFKVKSFSKLTNRLSTMQAYSGVPWMGDHDRGNTIGGKILIPLSMSRIGYKKWKQLISDLDRASNLFFEKKGGSTYAWCKNTPAFKNQLAPFRKFQNAQNKAKGIKKKIKFNEKVIIGVYKKQITLRKKIKMTEIVRDSLPLIIDNIQQSWV